MWRRLRRGKIEGTEPPEISEGSAPHRRQPSRDSRADPLGLIVLHTPPNRAVDILFIHGLGGTSLRSWCRDRDLDYLWPRLWLPEDIPEARVLTFGYNAYFLSTKERASLTISDFATDLLFRMKYGESGDIRLGQVPIVVVAHSMGGLVFKKAFVQGHLNEDFRNIIDRITAVLFLGTPHRGTALAETLNNILAGSFLGHSPKDYVSELARRSPTLDELNESFRHHAPKLQIFSFYETLSTPVGLTSITILDKTSSITGYPKETTQPLIANHHNVCKFVGVNDPNYASVVGALRTIVSANAPSDTEDSDEGADFSRIQGLLGVRGAPEEDLAAARSVRRPGTCGWFMPSEEVKHFVGSETPEVLWANAPPGSGKSTLCSFVIDRLSEAGNVCAYFFFKYGSRDKQSVSVMLQSLAYQTALQVPAFRNALERLAKSGAQLQNVDSVTLWNNLYLRVLSTIRTETDIFWILDGIDESDSAKRVVDFITTAGTFRSPIRVLAFSRPLPTIRRAFHLAKQRVPVVDMALPSNREDIRLAVEGEIDYLHAKDDFKAYAVRKITSRAQGNFLWANLVLQRIAKCRRYEQIEQILEALPDGMEQLYDRMLNAVVDLDVEDDKDLARIFLQWAVHAKIPLGSDELVEVYPAELGSIMDINHTIDEVCGQFVVVDVHQKVTLIHHSAREYLRKTHRLPFLRDAKSANKELFARCLASLCDKSLRRRMSSLKLPRFVPYAATSWAFHLELCHAGSDKVLDALVKFFSGPFTLAWIQYLAMSGHLSILFQVSRVLSTYAKERRKAELERSQMLHRLSDLALVETWATDLMKIPAKFGSRLSQDPLLIYKCIPALSPSSSIIHQKYAANPAATVSISGHSNAEWDDCLARVSANTGRALRLAASSLHLAVASDAPRGTVTLWDSELFQEMQSFDVGEHIWELEFNKSGSLLACYGITKTFVWKTDDGSVLLETANPAQERAIEFKYDDDDDLMVVTDLRRVYKLPMSEGSHWTQLSATLLQEANVREGTFLSTPSAVSFNHDCTQMAVAYRSFPLSIWNLDPPEMVARLRKKSSQRGGSANSHTGDNKVVWHPFGTVVLGISGRIFKWGPVDDTYEEVKDYTGVIPHGIQCSPNGRVFITSDVEGSVKIYDVYSMSLIYKLRSEDSVSRICFSPGSVRFYDLRGSYCNVWEPNCLIRAATEAPEQVSDTESTTDSFWPDTEDTHSTSISLPVSESQAASRPAIEVIAAGQKCHELLAYAHEAGAIEIFDPRSDRKYIVVQTMFATKITHMAWSGNHSLLAYSLSHGATTVKSVSVRQGGGQGGVSTKDVYTEGGSRCGERGPTKQLIFDTEGGKLLIHGAKKTQIVSMENGEVVAECHVPENEISRWQRHPLDPGFLIRATLESMSTVTWALKSEATASLDIPSIKNGEAWAIDEILQGHCPRFILLRIVTMRRNRPQYDSMVLSTDALDPLSPSAPEAVHAITIPDAVRHSIQDAISIQPDGQLVFLDKDLWLCTVPLAGDDWAVVRHFFLPRDWVTRSGIRICTTLRDGTFICPRKGEVAVIKGDLLFR